MERINPEESQAQQTFIEKFVRINPNAEAVVVIRETIDQFGLCATETRHANRIRRYYNKVKRDLSRQQRRIEPQIVLIDNDSEDDTHDNTNVQHNTEPLHDTETRLDASPISHLSSPSKSSTGASEPSTSSIGVGEGTTCSNSTPQSSSSSAIKPISEYVITFGESDACEELSNDNLGPNTGSVSYELLQGEQFESMDSARRTNLLLLALLRALCRNTKISGIVNGPLAAQLAEPRLLIIRNQIAGSKPLNLDRCIKFHIDEYKNLFDTISLLTNYSITIHDGDSFTVRTTAAADLKAINERLQINEQIDLEEIEEPKGRIAVLAQVRYANGEVRDNDCAEITLEKPVSEEMIHKQIRESIFATRPYLRGVARDEYTLSNSNGNTLINFDELEDSDKIFVDLKSKLFSDSLHSPTETSEPVTFTTPIPESQMIHSTTEWCYPKQKEVGFRLFQKIKEGLLRSYNLTDDEALQERFDSVEFLLLTPNINSILSQTRDRCEQWKMLGNGSVVWKYMKDTKNSRPYVEFQQRALSDENKQTLFVIIADECHMAIKAGQHHDKMLNDPALNSRPNVVTLLVSATPWNVITSASRIPERRRVKDVAEIEKIRSLDDAKKAIMMNAKRIQVKKRRLQAGDVYSEFSVIEHRDQTAPNVETISGWSYTELEQCLEPDEENIIEWFNQSSKPTDMDIDIPTISGVDRDSNGEDIPYHSLDEYLHSIKTNNKLLHSCTYFSELAKAFLGDQTRKSKKSKRSDSASDENASTKPTKKDFLKDALLLIDYFVSFMYYTQVRWDKDTQKLKKPSEGYVGDVDEQVNRSFDELKGKLVKKEINEAIEFYKKRVESAHESWKNFWEAKLEAEKASSSQYGDHLVITETDRIIRQLLDIHRDSDNPTDRPKGILSLVRVTETKSGDIWKSALEHIQSSFGLERVFALIPDYGDGCLYNRISPFFRQYIKHNKKRGTPDIKYQDLTDMPALVILVNRVRVGDTLPHSFRCLDLRIRHLEVNGKLSSIVQELGRLCRYAPRDHTLPYALVSQQVLNTLEKIHDAYQNEEHEKKTIELAQSKIDLDIYMRKVYGAKRLENIFAQLREWDGTSFLRKSFYRAFYNPLGNSAKSNTTTKQTKVPTKQCSYDDRNFINPEWLDRRFLLSAQTQIGKTAAYMRCILFLQAFFRCQEPEYVFIEEPESCDIQQTPISRFQWELPYHFDINKQQFTEYSNVLYAKYHPRMELLRVRALLKSGSRGADWLSDYISYLKSTTGELITCESGKQRIDELERKLKGRAGPPCSWSIREKSFRVEDREAFDALINWDGRLKRESDCPYARLITASQPDSVDWLINSDLKDSEELYMPRTRVSLVDNRYRSMAMLLKAYNANESSLQGDKLHSNGKRIIKTLKFPTDGHSDFLFSIPACHSKMLRSDGKLVKAYRMKRWVFTPSHRKPRDACLDRRRVYKDKENTIQVVVVRQDRDNNAGYFKEYETEWRDTDMIIMGLPTKFVTAELCEVSSGPTIQSLLRNEVKEVTDEEGKIGFARLAIQLIANQLGLEYIWMLDDNIVECRAFDLTANSREEPKPCAFDEVMNEIEKLPKYAKSEEWITKYKADLNGLQPASGTTFKIQEDFTDAFNKYGLIGLRRNWRKWKIGNKPFSKTHRVYSMFLLNVRDTVEKGILFPPKAVWEDIEFNHMCHEAGLWVVRCNRFFHDKRNDQQIAYQQYLHRDQIMQTIRQTMQLFPWTADTQCTSVNASPSEQPPSEADKQKLANWIRSNVSTLYCKEDHIYEVFRPLCGNVTCRKLEGITAREKIAIVPDYKHYGTQSVKVIKRYCDSVPETHIILERYGDFDARDIRTALEKILSGFELKIHSTSDPATLAADANMFIVATVSKPMPSESSAKSKRRRSISLNDALETNNPPPKKPKAL